MAWPLSSVPVEHYPIPTSSRSINIIEGKQEESSTSPSASLPVPLLCCLYRIPMPFTKDCFSYLVCLCVLVRFCLQFVWTQNFFGDKTKEYQTASAYPIKNLCLQTQLYRNYEVKNYLPFLPNTQLLHDCGQDQTKELRQDTRRCSCSR